MKKIYTLLVATLLACLNKSQSSKILGIFPIQSKSHFKVHEPIMKALASRGHKVTVMSAFPEANISANYTSINIGENLETFIDSVDINEATTMNFESTLYTLRYFPVAEGKHCSYILSNDVIKKAVNFEEKYDLLFAEMYYIPCYLPLAVKLNVPIIWIIAPVSDFTVDKLIGNPNNPSYVPIVTSGLAPKMDFFQRLYNVMEYVFTYILHVVYFESKFKDEFSSIYAGDVEMTKVKEKLGLVFLHSHYLLTPKPNQPNVVEIGGVHIMKEKPLQKDIQQYIDESKHGIIFFSFGTMLKCSSMSKRALVVFREAFSKIPQVVLWRCDVLNLTGFSANVKFGEWFPQRDILEHKNARAFISHGGLLSTYEAIYTGTPVIGIPFVYDQPSNIATLEQKGAAIYVDYYTMTADKLLNAINKIINDTSYKENMMKLSKIFKDRPMSALDTAVYWTEYIIRHKDDMSHLKSAAADMPLYQYLLLDVIVFVILSASALLYLTFTIFRKVLSVLKTVLCKNCISIPINSNIPNPRCKID